MKYFLKYPLVFVYVPLMFCFILVRACFTGTADAKPSQANEITIVIGGRVMNYSDLKPGYVSEPLPQTVAATIPSNQSEPKIHKSKNKKTAATQKARTHKTKTKHRKIREQENSNHPMIASVNPAPPLADYDDPDVRQKVLARYDYWQRRHHTEKVYWRIAQYEPIINEYSALFGMDSELPWGLIAVESAGKSNAVSRVKAKGLTQIYKIPRSYHDEARQILGRDDLNIWDPRHNILLGMITLKNYTQLKNNDLLLGLVSYNCGPDHKKVKRVSQYRDLSIKKSIKRYPIDVLAWTLVVKVKKTYGEVLPYNQENKEKIESIYLPGI